jgi:predicted transcriptional regulator
MMDLDSVFVDSRWEVIRALSTKPLSPTELAKLTKTTIANISTQLRFLEALNLVEKQRMTTVKPGKPRTLYTMKKEFAYLVLASSNLSGKKLMKLDEPSSVLLNTLFITPPEAQFYVQKFFFNNCEVILKSQAMAFLGIKEKEIEILLVNENSKDLYERFKDIRLDKCGEVRKLLVTLHTPDEMLGGLERKEDATLSLLTRSAILHDTNGFLSNLKRNIA